MIEKWNELIAKAKIPRVIAMMLDRLKELEDQDYYQQAIMISSRQEELKKNMINELVTEESGRVQQNKIKASILMLIEELEDDDDINLSTDEISKSPDTSVDKNIEGNTPEVIIEKVEGDKNIENKDAENIDAENVKDQARLKLQELQALRKEETFTLPGANLFKIQLNITELEKELDELKETIRKSAS